MIACGLKILGKDHIQTQLDACVTAQEKGWTDLIVGFDMVNEEDFTPEIDHFLDQIYETREKLEKMGGKLDLYLHCGESNSRDNQ